MHTTQILGGTWINRSCRHIAQIAMIPMILLATCAQAADMTEADMVRQLSARSGAAATDNDPNAAFANDDMPTKSLTRVRRPDTNGACLAGDGDGASQKTLVVIALAVTGSPQIIMPLQFSNASYVLTKSDRKQLDTLARAMSSTELRDARFTVSGHTDASGDALSNEKLSCARAISARTHLIERGVAAERLSAYGFGSARPVVSGANRSAENRRVEIRRADD